MIWEESRKHESTKTRKVEEDQRLPCRSGQVKHSVYSLFGFLGRAFVLLCFRAFVIPLAVLAWAPAAAFVSASSRA